MRKYAVVFVHGLAKKPPPEKLEEIWRWGLERSSAPAPFDGKNPGINLNTKGVPAVFNYYADVFYAEDYETSFDSYYESEGSAVVKEENLKMVAGDLAEPSPANLEEKKFLEEFERKMRMAPSPAEPSDIDESPAAQEPAQLEIASWLPRPVKEAIIKKAAMEAYYFLFDKEYVRPQDGKAFKVREELRNRLLAKLREAAEKGEKLVLVTHSMGTMVAYDVLRNCPGCPPVDTLFTLGSPLGVTEVQEQLVAKDRKKVDFPPLLGRWVNVYDPLDPVCGADPRFNDYAPFEGRAVEDVKESNWGSWRHTITHYFAGKRFRALFAQAVGVELK
ncbi:triacylglycerol lipase [Variovorax sp. YR216]|uniref:esterase/lipase family protein n=1 Tax=Variovorax sp. YR216 TaxID=1882828 RepID=UPI0008945D52|nr:hypothetical protein [Variovorax sp. YR216]SEB22704.1 hypothetical protein SAMN05444680_116134 [Variovorax sp. YR216]